jgi:DinB superfamily
MTSAERDKIIDLLETSRARFLRTVTGLSDEQWKWKPAPERWSVAECAEHIVAAEAALFSKMQEALAKPPDPYWEKKTGGKTEFLERALVNRTTKVQAPARIVPQGKLARAEVMERYGAERERTLRFARETQAPLKQQTSEHSLPLFNTLNAYQWLIYIPLHNIRHTMQMEELIAAPGFPK